jgi:hypothetical protein
LANNKSVEQTIVIGLLEAERTIRRGSLCPCKSESVTSYLRQVLKLVTKEQEQLAALKKQMDQTKPAEGSNRRDEIEGGLAPGMEDLEDRYATTSGEH